MKKYVLLMWDTYYPGGGLGDVVASYDDLEEAKTIAQGNNIRQEFGGREYFMSYDHAEIADRDTWEIIWER